MLSISDVFILLAVSQLVTTSLYFLLHNKDLLGRLIAFLGVCLICFVLTDFTPIVGNSLASYLNWRLATLTPFVLWFIAFKLFTDGEKLHPVWWLPVIYFVVVRTIGVPLYDADGSNSYSLFVLIYVIPQVIMLIYSCYAILLAMKGYKIDLVEERRQFRVVFVISVGVLMVMRGLDGFFSFTDPFLDNFSLFALNPFPRYVFPLYVFMVLLIFNLSVFRLQGQAFNIITSSKKQTPNEMHVLSVTDDSSNGKLLHKLIDLMEKQRMYSQPGLTITHLAKSLAIQEYRLRKFINKELKYKNFNQFLNSYRIAEASERLLTERTPISSIALDIGYASMSSFNGAFKARYGMTPSEYRNQHNVENFPRLRPSQKLG